MNRISISPKAQTAYTLCICAALLVLSVSVDAAAQPKKRSAAAVAEPEAVITVVDIVQTKETADSAQRAAAAAKREIAALNAKIIQLDNRLLLAYEDAGHVSAAKIEEVELRLALLTEAYKELFVKVQVLENHVERITLPKPHPPQNKSTFTPSSDDVLVSSPEYDLYQAGLRLFNGRNYTQAAKMFTECLDKFPDGMYRDNAQYWIGESFYQMAQMEIAIEAYKKVFSYPNTKKADAAQFKIALAYQKLGQTERAKAEFRRLIERYPASDFAERSKKYLHDLK